MNVLLLTLALCGADQAEATPPIPVDWMAIEPFRLPPEAQKTLAPSVQQNREKRTCILRNRGTIVSQQMYPDDVTLSFTWKWTEGDLEKKYPDHLAIVLFSSAEQKKWPFEVDEGVVIRFNPGARHAIVQHFKEAQEVTRLATMDGLTFDKNTKYKIKIEATKATIVVSVDGEKVLEAKVPEELKGQKVLIYNREPVAGIVKESVLTELTITKK